MKSKETYKTPEIRSEKLEMGVFGTYGCDGKQTVIDCLSPFFSYCCS